MKRIFVLLLAAALVSGCAQAAFYTSNADLFYHADARCAEGSTFEISENAAWQFEKLACPICVNRTSVKGEIIEIPLPEGYVRLLDADFRDGKILLCGYVDMANSRPWLAEYDIRSGRLQENLGEPTNDIIRNAAYLSDGKIAVVRSNLETRRNSDSVTVGPGDDSWSVQLIENGKVVFRSAGMNYLSGIWPLEDGFIVHGASKIYQYQLARCDNAGNVLWSLDIADIFPTSDNQPGLTGLLTGEDMHIAWGRRAASETDYLEVIVAFDDSGKILTRHEPDRVVGQRTKTIYNAENEPVGWETADVTIGNFTCAAASADSGAVFCGGRSNRGYAAKYGAGGEVWFSDFAHIYNADGYCTVDGKSVQLLSAQSALPFGDGWLLVLSTNTYTPYLGKSEAPADRGYVCIVQLNGEGRIVRIWFEETGDVVTHNKIRLFRQGADVCMLACGGRMVSMEAYEQGLPVTKIPQGLILKKIA